MQSNKITPIDRHQSTISMLKPDQSIPSKLIKQDQIICRICLDGEEQVIAEGNVNQISNLNNIEPNITLNRLIKPCKCSGSIQSVHEKCIKMWIEKKLKQQNNSSTLRRRFSNKRIFCELCKAQIHYSSDFQVQLDFKIGCKGLNKINTCYLAILVATLVLIAILGVMIGNVQLLNFNQNGFIVLIVSMIIMCILLIVIVIGIIKLAYSKKLKRIDRIYQRNQQLRQRPSNASISNPHNNITSRQNNSRLRQQIQQHAITSESSESSEVSTQRNIQ